ncbi:hypothetical protein ACSBR2_038029 [Camellia fascicularis]
MGSWGLHFLELELSNPTDVVFEINVSVKLEKSRNEDNSSVDCDAAEFIDRDNTARVLIPLEHFKLPVLDSSFFVKRTQSGTPGRSSSFSEKNAKAELNASIKNLISKIKVRWQSGRNSSGELNIEDAIQAAFQTSVMDVLLPDPLTFGFKLAENSTGHAKLSSAKESINQVQSPLSKGSVLAHDMTSMEVLVRNNTKEMIRMSLSITCRDVAGENCIEGKKATVLWSAFWVLDCKVPPLSLSMKPSNSISHSLSMKPSNSNSSHNHQRFGTSLMRKLKRCFSCYKPTESASGSKERYKGKMSCNLSETTGCGEGGYSEMIQNAISYCKDSLIKGDTKANETPIEEPETEAKVLDIPSPCSMDIDSQTSNPLPQVINGVPKGLRIEDVLGRIALLLLIRGKVKAASEKPSTPLFSDDIVSRFPGLKSGRFWKERHDLLLLRAVLKHGYGRWQAIVDDKDLKVQEVICQELNLPVVTLPVPGASQSQDGANVVSAETPMNETKGTVVGNDLGVDAANRAPDAANRSQLFQDSSSLYHYREMQRRQVEFIKKKVLFLEKLQNTEYEKEAFKLDVNEPAREQTEPSTTGHWEEKELVSRDGQAQLKANVFFASFDQRSDKAAGESACTALAAVIASWLQSNQDNTPMRAQFDRLIVEGSSEWRKLCDNQDLINQFPNKHFDIETVLQAKLCPISVLHEKSFIGFFGPEKFETLKGVMSFDQIWDEIKKNAEGDNDMPRIYIVSWNDHLFVLKVDVNAYYIIDTFGERLFEGCNKAYILRFDDSALMRGKVEKEGVSSDQASEDEICSGKECCREFMKRFLAAIPLRELESEEKKEPGSYLALHQQLQIEFNFTTSLSLSSSSSTSSTNSTASLFSNESTNR